MNIHKRAFQTRAQPVQMAWGKSVIKMLGEASETIGPGVRSGDTKKGWGGEIM